MRGHEVPHDGDVVKVGLVTPPGARASNQTIASDHYPVQLETSDLLKPNAIPATSSLVYRVAVLVARFHGIVQCRQRLM